MLIIFPSVMENKEETVEELYNRYLERAENGEVSAQLALALLLNQLALGDRQEEEAKWIRKASETSKFGEALKYFAEIDVEENADECMRLLKEYKEEKGELTGEEKFVADMTAALILTDYENEENWEEEEEKLVQAFRVFLLYHEEGRLEASFQLAICYSSACGCNEDKEKAFDMYTQLATRGHVGSTLIHHFRTFAFINFFNRSSKFLLTLRVSSLTLQRRFLIWRFYIPQEKALRRT